MRKRPKRLLRSVGYGWRQGNVAKLCQIRRQPVEVVTVSRRVQQLQVDDRTRRDLLAEKRFRPFVSDARVAGACPRRLVGDERSAAVGRAPARHLLLTPGEIVDPLEDGP